MDKISCYVTLTCNNREIDEEKIFDYVIQEAEKKQICYGDVLKYNMEYEGLYLKRIKIQTNDKIEIPPDVKSGIYFILNDTGDKILYVGKSKTLATRLKNHLIECSTSTSSHINEVIEYLSNLKSDQLILKYCYIKVEKYLSTIEGMLIDYMKSIDLDMFKENWNKRND